MIFSPVSTYYIVIFEVCELAILEYELL